MLRRQKDVHESIAFLTGNALATTAMIDALIATHPDKEALAAAFKRNLDETNYALFRSEVLTETDEATRSGFSDQALVWRSALEAG